MTLPAPPPALLAVALLAATLTAAGCAGSEAPPGAARAFAAGPGTPVTAQAVPARSRQATVAPAGSQRSYSSPPPTPAQQEQATIVATCRDQAEQIILQRDRGQLLRDDENAARLGASTSIHDIRVPIARMERQFARDRMAEDCVDANRPRPPVPITAPAAPGPAATTAEETAAATTRQRR